MAKKFNFRGLELEPLQKLSNDELLKILPSRQRRSLLRANFNDSKRSLIAEIKDTADGKSKKTIKTHIRDLIILPYMIGVTVNVFSGKEFKPVVISIEMIRSLLGRVCDNQQKSIARCSRCRCISFQSIRSVKVIIMGRFDYAFQNFDETRHIRHLLEKKTYLINMLVRLHIHYREKRLKKLVITCLQ